MPLLSRKRLILAKTESPYGTDSSPDGTDAILVRELEITPLQSDTVERELIRPYLGASQTLLANTRVEVTFQVEMAGSGTAGTAPAFGRVIQACGFSATTTAAAVTGTAQAGAAGSITLASGASATDNIYNGMVISITSGAGSGSSGVITAYNGSTKVATVQKTTAAFTPDNTSVYSIAANVGYKPVSSTFSSVSIYYNIDGLLHKVTGCRGTFTINGAVGEIPYIEFTMTGIYNSPTDTAAPAATYANQSVPVVFKNGNTTNFELLSYAGCLQSIELDVGNEVIYRELVGCSKEVLITNRAITGTIVIEAPTIAQKDYFTAALSDSTLGNFTLKHGQAAGNIVTLTTSTVDIGDPSYEDQDGIHMLSIPVTAVPGSVGNDEMILTFT
jgi:hypothetical protein